MKKIAQVVRNVPQHWVGDGFPVRSLFSYAQGEAFDPFLLLDYAGPAEFPPAEGKRGVDVHPHKGFETVTILYEGGLAHRDSSGGSGTLGPGDVQWMTAASGVVHEEFHSEAFTRRGGALEMVQLWVNLPAKDKSAPPRYQDLRAAQFPHVDLPNGAGSVRVIAGEFDGVRGPAQTFTAMNVWDLQLNAGGEAALRAPEGHTAVLVVQRGELSANGTALRGVELARFEREGEAVTLTAETPARALFLTGEPLNEPVVGQGPFVMNTREEIRQAIQDFQTGRMGTLD
ncbi:pirin family protein [Alienimonas californiensis]|uniref:Quercetin 2,3-dioxygenase n=1 Tax=Alienimonas californiensis TaxID=2527989 RepID=A0A517PAT6_9PLAN|nr:pirin family protein [Alienimonas californiensis]QDT16471.1 Quercetin 2,3-dioxygenase [Alienimonas californiensis]